MPVRLVSSLAAVADQPDPAITLVRGGGLGDTILLLPTLALLRTALPGVQLTLVGSAWAESLDPLLPFPLTIRLFDSSQMATLFAGPAPDRLGIFGGNAVILYTDDPGSAFVQNAKRACDGAVIVCAATQIAGIHAALHYANAIADTWDELPIPQLRVAAAAFESARSRMRSVLGTDQGVVAIHPGSGGRRKCWPLERWVGLLQDLRRPVVLLQGPADAPICNALRAGLPAAAPVLSITDRSVAEAAGYIQAAAFYVGNDSGMSHLAAALGVASAVVFGPTDPSVWRPLGPHVSIVAATRPDWPNVHQVLSIIRGRK